MNHHQSNLYKLQILKGSLKDPNWSTKEKNVIEELLELKRFDRAHEAAIDCLTWRLGEIDSGKHRLIQSVWNDDGSPRT